ncbi:MAG: response regulator transcription factor [Thermoflexales bacterium]|nr:response regulator transcription factor [Thermoflexales bacterium]
MTRVLIVDDQPSFRRQLRQLLVQAGLHVVGEAGDIPTAESLAQALQPDMAVVDMMLPGVDGLEGTLRLKTLLPGLRVILISALRDRAHIFQSSAHQAGAEAFFAKDDLDLSLVKTWKEPVRVNNPGKLE